MDIGLDGFCIMDGNNTVRISSGMSIFECEMSITSSSWSSASSVWKGCGTFEKQVWLAKIGQ